MASRVIVTLTWGTDTASLTLLDPLGSNNTWSCDPPSFLSKADGVWAQGLGAAPVILSDKTDKFIVLQFEALNMFKPRDPPQSGDAIAFGEGGTVGDTQVVHWEIDQVVD